MNQEFIAKHPGVKLTLKDGMAKPLSTGGSVDPDALDGIDIAFLPDTSLAPAVEANLLKDLSAVKLPQPSEALERVWSDLGKVDGRQFGLPVAVAPSMIRVNDQVLQEAGIKALPADWTWQDFEQALTAARAAGVSIAVQLPARRISSVPSRSAPAPRDPRSSLWVLPA